MTVGRHPQRAVLVLGELVDVHDVLEGVMRLRGGVTPKSTSPYCTATAMPGAPFVAMPGAPFVASVYCLHAET